MSYATPTNAALSEERAFAARSSFQTFESSGGIADGIDVDLHAVEHRHPEVVERRVLVVTNMTAGLDRAATAAGQEDGEIVVVVGVAVGVTAAVGDHAVVEER